MIIKAHKALIGRKLEKNVYIKIQEGIITSISKEEQDFDFATQLLSPGFIDNHCHGFAGHDFMEANQKAYDAILSQMVKTGTTSVMATAVTQSLANIKKMFKYASKHKGFKQTSIIGIHSEGPFLSKIKKGAQPEEYIIQGSANLLQELYEISNKKLKVMTYAPEFNKDASIVKKASQLGINMQIGHTMASKEDVTNAVKNGARGITHVYNAMPKSMENETSGFVAKENIYGEVILDGIHNSAKQVEDFIDLKGKDKTILITDALMCAGQPDGEYMLGGQKVVKKGIKCTLKNSNTIAGSASSMIAIIKKGLEITKFTLEELLVMASVNVANYHQLDNIGIIKEGKQADLICLDSTLNVKKVLIKGEIVYEN